MPKKNSNTYILVDTMNMFFRSKHFAKGGDINLKIGMAMHIMFNSLRKLYRESNNGHVVMCLEGHSWRYELLPEYKLPRKIKRLEAPPAQQEEDAIFLEALEDLIDFMRKKTNATVIQAPNSEADDLIALWCQSHPDDNNIIVSSDQDYLQLIDEHVSIYNGVEDITINLDGFFDSKGKRIEKKGEVNPEWMLFEKCIRGDKSDNIHSAYPGCRTKGTLKKVGMTEAFEDRNNGGFNWNNFMLQRWTDANGQEQRVRDRYEFNKKLIDLTMQPDYIRKECMEAILEQTSKKPVPMVGLHFLKFCGKWDLKRISDTPDDFARVLSHRYGT